MGLLTRVVERVREKRETYIRSMSAGDKHYGNKKKKQYNRRNECKEGLGDSIFYRPICMLLYFFPLFKSVK